MMTQLALRLAKSDAEIEACLPMMTQLRPHVSASEFVPRVRNQMEQGYQLLYGIDVRDVVALAGFRLIEMLATGRMLYVDDLVTDSRAVTGIWTPADELAGSARASEWMSRAPFGLRCEPIRRASLLLHAADEDIGPPLHDRHS